MQDSAAPASRQGESVAWDLSPLWTPLTCSEAPAHPPQGQGWLLPPPFWGPWSLRCHCRWARRGSGGGVERNMGPRLPLLCPPSPPEWAQGSRRRSLDSSSPDSALAFPASIPRCNVCSDAVPMFTGEAVLSGQGTPSGMFSQARLEKESAPRT